MGTQIMLIKAKKKYKEYCNEEALRQVRETPENEKEDFSPIVFKPAEFKEPEIND